MENTATERKSDHYFRENLTAILDRSQSWQDFKNNNLEYPESDDLNSQSNRPRTYRGRLRLLALEVLVVAKREGKVGWASSQAAEFWCELAEVNQDAYRRAMQKQQVEKAAAQEPECSEQASTR